MGKYLEKVFRLSQYDTNIKTEMIAGITTFVTMAYVLATVPNMLGNAGLNKSAVMTAVILLIVITTCAMAFYTNRPFALAPGLGSTGIVVSMITNEGISPEKAAGVIFLSGILFIAISFLGLREAVVKVIPVSLKHAVSAGIGLFIALLGAKSCGLIAASEKKNSLTFGDLRSPEVILCLIGFCLMLLVKIKNIPGGIILSSLPR
jgi:AGZA family xanthine/uracil permease-like MFS transporter